MVEIMRTNDQVRLSWAMAVLKEGGIRAVVLDAHMSIMEGSIGALPRRLMVADDDAGPARQMLAQAERAISVPEADFETSDDAFLGGALRLLQPRRGYRAGSDAVLLAAAVRAEPGEWVLDAGAGVGAVGLALAQRLPAVHIDALELQPELAALAAENAQRNGLADRLAVYTGDLAAPPAALLERPYDHVVSNPPYHQAAASQGSPRASRDLARRESHLALPAWIAACLGRLKPGGSLTLIHPAERREAVLAALAPAAGGAVVLPLLAGRERPAKRAITRAVKGSGAAPAQAPGFLLHQADGSYTEAAEAVLRQGAALEIAAAQA